ncbi:MAG TPA: adenylyl-sulfate kinase [Actinomycetes bacterium]|nr:adenylyl-sulfate kinase [Actinomycetes bacterium]
MPAAAALPEIGLDLEPDEVDDLDLVLRGALDGPILTLDRVGAAPAELTVGSQLLLRDPEGAPVGLLTVTELIGVNEHRYRIAGAARPVPDSGATGGYRRFADLPSSPAEVAARLAGSPGAVLAVPVTGPPSDADLDTIRAAAAKLGIGPATLLLLVQIREQALGSYPAPRLVRQIVQAVDNADLDAVVVPIPLPATPDPADRGYAWAQLAARYGASHLLLPREVIAAVDTGSLSIIPVPGQLAGTPDADRTRRGVTVFFTGLSGSGKSTVAKALRDRLLADGRTVSLLDGDEVRRLLSAELGFSRAERDLNVRRIGFVAAEITRHGGIAICAPIAPYAPARAGVRSMVARHGDFILVYLDTPLTVCESRDRKGLYAKARQGLIAEFTGISDPYQPPDDADLRIDTSQRSVEESVELVYAVLRDRLTTSG